MPNFVYGTNASETINLADGVTNGNDDIYGYGGNDTIYGLGGDDVIVGGAGADTIYGGTGKDRAAYFGSSAGVIVSLMTGAGLGGDAEGDILSGIEDLTGSNYNDFLIGNNGANVLSGLAGNDTLKGGGGADELFGGSDNDMLHGGTGGDYLHGGSGIDTASYSGSSEGVFVALISDHATGGDAQGDELDLIENLTGSSHDDNLWGDNGVNVLNGEGGHDTLKGYGGADTLNGGSGNDQLFGMDGDDILNGGAGDDTMKGGAGNDQYYVNSAADIVTELAGEGTADVVYANISDYVMADNIEIVSLADSLVGLNAHGNDLNNTMFGNANDNALNGGVGADHLNGLGGNDTFVFVAGQANGDTVYEFNGNGAGVGDVLKFSGYGTIAEGATFHQITATQWQVTSADGTMQETLTFADGFVIDTTTDLVFV